MKKLLAGLLTFLLVGMLLNAAGILNNKKPVNEIKPSHNTVISNNGTKESYVPIKVDNETGFKSGWYVYTIEGNVESVFKFDEQVHTIHHPSSSIDGIQVVHDGMPWTQGDTISISADISSSRNRDIELVISNCDTGEEYARQRISLTGETTSFKYDFTMIKDTTFNGRIAFSIGNDGSSSIMDKHEVSLENIRIRNTSSEDNTIKVNQLGYLVDTSKKCTFPYNQGDFFDVVNIESGEIVYTGAIVNGAFNDKTGETNFFGDFTNVLEPGTYQIKSQIVSTSVSFTISDSVYENTMRDLIKFLTIQRCGYYLDEHTFGGLSHDVCHDHGALLYEDQPRGPIDVTGGWHDAGDYGRYVKTGTKTVNDLLLAYMINPAMFNDDLGIPETGNSIPDILDEARFEIEWLMKMQADWGGVYNKAVTPSFPGDIVPEEDKQPIYILPAETTTTADFISTMALASIVYKELDPSFSERCLAVTEKAWANLTGAFEFVELTNPEGFVAGEYRDDKDTDERFFAAIAMWTATNEDKYIDYAKEMLNKDTNATTGTSWRDVGAYGSYLFLVNENAKEHKKFYKQVSESLKYQADTLLNIVHADGYQVSLENYSWGSNGFVANNGILLMFAYHIFDDENYKQAAVEQVNYLYGKNSLNMSFVSGYGQKYPQNMHHRIVKAKKTDLRGALVGGPDSDREDPFTQALGENTPPAKVYVDEYLSFSSNEVTIYWNGALVNLISQISK